MDQKLLIVDDEAHIRMLIEQTLEELEDEGVEFLTAENGEIALDAPDEWYGSLPPGKKRTWAG